MLTKLKYLNKIFDNNYSQTLPSRRSHSDKLIKKIFSTPILEHKELYIRNRLLGFFFVEKIKQLTSYLLKK